MNYFTLLASEISGPTIGLLIVGGLICLLLLAAGIINGMSFYVRIFSNMRKLNVETTAHDLAQSQLEQLGVHDVPVVKGATLFGCRYGKIRKKIYLGRCLYNKNSVGAVAYAMRGVMFAKMQAENDQTFLRCRKMGIFAGVAGFSFIPLFLIGVVIDLLTTSDIGNYTLIFAILGLVLYIVGIVCAVASIKVEKVATKEAYDHITDMKLLDEDDLKKVKTIYKYEILKCYADAILTILYAIYYLLKILAILGKIFSKQQK